MAALAGIAGSVNVSARDLVDRETGAYLPADVLAERFAGVGAQPSGRVITYCGGGIAATSDALVLTLLGYGNVAVYDGSMSEWARDPEAPMEVG
jgi:thiosulfate/3-mercaptopyruvate sulfurtransferase